MCTVLLRHINVLFKRHTNTPIPPATVAVAHTKKATGLHILSATSRSLRILSTENVVAIKILPSPPEFQKYHQDCIFCRLEGVLGVPENCV